MIGSTNKTKQRIEFQPVETKLLGFGIERLGKNEKKDLLAYRIESLRKKQIKRNNSLGHTEDLKDHKPGETDI